MNRQRSTFRHFKRSRVFPIGIDLATDSLRAVQLKQSGQSYELCAAIEIHPSQDQPPTQQPEPQQQAIVDIDLEDSKLEQTPSNVETANDLDREKYLPLLNRLAESCLFHSRNVILHCPADKLDLRPVMLPSGPEGLRRKTIIGALKLQIDGHIGFPIDKAVFDYYITGYDDTRAMLSVVAITADADWIQRRVQLVEESGFNCLRIDALPCALARIVADTDTHEANKNADQKSQDKESDNTEGDNKNHDSQCEMKDSPEKLVAILDIGYGGTTLVVQGSAGPIFCRRFAFGGKTLTDTLAERLPINEKQAETLKIAYGLYSPSSNNYATMATNDNATATLETVEATQKISTFGENVEIARTIHGALRKELSDFLEGVVRSLNYVINESRGGRLADIMLCGSGGYTRELDSFFSDHLGFHVSHLRHTVLEEIVKLLPQTRAIHGRWTTALGLAIPKEQ